MVAHTGSRSDVAATSTRNTSMTWLRQSFQNVIDAQNGRTTGFDLMRIVLAVAVLTFHTITVCYGQKANLAAWAGPYRPIFMLMLPMFFGLSGFLVAGSLERTKGLHRFVGLRVIRIVPALAVETLLCAVLLGSFLTVLPLTEYFTSSEFWHYFLNVLGIIQYTLPGVYHGLPTDGIVNVSLWTVPYELECYLVLVILAALGITKNRNLFLVAVIGACAIAPFIFSVPNYMARPTGKLLVLSFLCGVLMYKFRERLPHNPLLALVALLIALYGFKGQQFAFWSAPFAVYVTGYLGLLRAPTLPLLSKGDYSYGLYLFAFPLQQLQAQLFPNHRDWYWNASFTIITGLIYAAFSWHLVEKPVLDRRKEILDWMDRVIGKIRAPFLKGRVSRTGTETT